MHEGRCLCGNVRYEVDGPFAAVVNCHCSMCRKHHGSAYVTWAVVPAGTLDTDPGIAATAHIFVDSRADWDTLGDDGLPRFAAMPPSR
jgi:hypothetical protein